MAKGMIFDILADSSQAKKEFNKFEEHALGVSATIAAAYAGTKLVQGFSDALVSESAGAKVAAQLDLIPASAQRANDAAKAAFRDGMGESLEEVSRAMSEVGEDMVDLNKVSETESQKMVTDALAIADVYDKDVSEVTRAAGALMKNGLAKDSDEAFDIITAGMQGGLDKTDEFLDTLWEYSEPLSALGIDGPQAIAMFGSALDAGAFSVDKAGDALNEFATRAIDGSYSTKEAFQELGMDADDMAAKIAAGGPTANAAFSEILAGLSSIKDPIEQDKAGVALFGSMWEDAGKGMVLAMDPAKQSIEDVTGATEDMGAVMYDTGEAKAESMRRGFDGMFQDLATLPGPLGSAAAGVQAFGGDLLAAGGSLGAMAIGLKGSGVATKTWSLITKGAAGAQKLLSAAMAASPIGMIVVGIALLVAGFLWLWNNVEGFRNFFIGAWNKIKAVWSAVQPFFEGLLGKVTGFFKGAWDFLKTVWKWTPIGMITSNWNAITGYLRGIPGKVVGFFGGIGVKIGNKFSTIKSTTKGYVDSVLDWFRGIPGKIGGFFSSVGGKITRPFKTAFNSVARFWNSSVGKVNFSVPNWVPGVGGKSFGIPKIPLLAKGGIATAATLAVVGEGPEDEVIAPISKLGGLMSDYLGDATVGAPTSTGSSDIHISLDGMTLEVRDTDSVLLGSMRTEADRALKGERRAQRVVARGRK